MAKSTVKQDKIGSFEDWKAPWESEAGNDAEIDKPKLKRLIFNLKLGEAKALDAVEDAKVDVTAAENERDTAKQEASDAAGGDAQKTIDKLTRERDAAVLERDKLQGEKDESVLRSEVLGDFAEKNPVAAKYVKGSTKEELEKSLEAVKADFGIEDSEGEEEEGDEDRNPLRSRPRSGLNNPADPKNGKGGDQPVDFDKVADGIILGGSVFR